jgi:hypothetical protein
MLRGEYDEKKQSKQDPRLSLFLALSFFLFADADDAQKPATIFSK